MDRNHMLAPASHRRSLSGHGTAASHTLGTPPPPLPLPLPLPLGFPRRPSHQSQHFQQPQSSSLSSPSPSTSSLTLPHPPSSSSPMHQYSNPPPLPPPAASTAAAHDTLPTRLPPLAHHDHDDRMLPSLSTITGDLAMRGGMAPEHPSSLPPPHWPPPAFNASPSPSTAYRQTLPHPPDSPATTMDFDGSGSVTSAPSPERVYEGTPTSLTLDDPDVRLAAEALGDLRADFVSSPPDTASLPPMSPPAPAYQKNNPLKSQPPPQAEPLLSLLTTAHPFVTSTIGGASSAYGGVKNFSPRFKSGAEYVEGYLTPIANTVNSVGRVTGVEGGVRWFLGAGRRHPAPTSDPDAAGTSKKRRKVGESSGNPYLDLDESYLAASRSPRRLSSASTVESLPAYDDQRSPAYTETATTPKPTNNAAWQSRLIMSTSGLSVAMSAESLRSLKYCLRWLRWTNGHMGRVIVNLKTALEEYERAESYEAAAAENMAVDGQQQREKTPQQSRTEIAARINSLKGDVLKTLQDVINNVSKYAGGALPENARILVRRHLTSLPQRFHVATMSDNSDEAGGKDSDSALREGAQKVLVLAKEGLDMVTQVTGVLDGTIVSAEQWCERMGKRRRQEKDDEEPMAPPPMQPSGDIKMG